MRDKVAFISIVMPLYNEEKYIANCIESLLEQDYPRDKMEWLFVDGGSCDKTRTILKRYQNTYPSLIKLLDNPNKTVPYAMNKGIRAAAGEYIIRLDAHAEYATDYFSKCVYYLQNTDADNVGGVIKTKSSGKVGEAIASVVSSKFGVGNSQFRTNGSDGYVDTVPFGAFRREVFEKYGLYDERLTRNQDNEMNYRIRANGGKIFLSNDIKLAYYSRDTIKGILKMAFQNGKWNVITMKLCPGSMGIRHFVPLAFLLSLIILPILSVMLPFFRWIFLAELLLYLLLNVVSSIKKQPGRVQNHVFLKMIIFPLFHIFYGVGSLFGLITLLFKFKA